jgi:thymidylate kinase
MHRGLFIVLESVQSTTTRIQLNLLKERLKAIGYEVAQFDLPNYDKGSSHFIQQYQSGAYGRADSISPYTTALFYALDRYESSIGIEKALNAGKIVLATNYVGSTMAKLGSRFSSNAEKRGFFVWEDNLEFELLKLHRPDINIYIKDKQTSKPAPKAEAFDSLCELFPKDFKAVENVAGKDKLSVAKLNDEIWQILKPRLPKYRPNPSHSVVVSLSDKQKVPEIIQEAGNERLVIPVKSGSLFLKTMLERLAPGSITPSSYSWSENLFQVYSPENMDKVVLDQYKRSLKNIALIHQAIQEKISPNDKKNTSTSDLLLSITPFFALASFKLALDKRQVREVSASLLNQDASEAQWLAKQIYLAARQKWPQDFKQPLESDDAVSISNILSMLPSENLSPDGPADEAVKVLDVTPRQEFDLLAESIYPYSNLSLREITDSVADWPYSQKYQSLLQAVRQPVILQKAQYKMDIISDQLVLSRLSRAVDLTHVQVQAFTPRYGYDVPTWLEDLGLDDLYASAFDESLKLYSLLQSVNRDDIAPYAALLGHKVRWQLDTDAAQLKEAFDTKDGSGYAELIHDITEAVAEIHPLLWHILSGSASGQPMANLPSNNNRIKPYHQRHKRRPKPKK